MPNAMTLMSEAAVEEARSFTVQGPMVSFEFNLGGFQVVVTESVIVQFLVVVVLGIVFFILGRNLKVEPTSKRQAAAEWIVGMFNGMVNTTMGEKYSKFQSYIGALFCLSMVSSLSSLFGFRAPTSDLSVVAAWGIVTFVLCTGNKLRTGGVKGYLKSFVQPLPFMLPFNIIGEFANPIAQTLRHFANILAGSVIGGLIYFALGNFAVGLPAVLSLYFDLFSAVIQAYIFVTLTMSYVSLAECD